MPPVRVRFFVPPPELAPYVTTFYLMEHCAADGAVVEDYLHPEWGNIRFGIGADCLAAIGKEDLRRMPDMVATGPTSLAARFVFRKGAIWGIGLLPLGWLRFVGVPAHGHADRFVDGAADEAFVAFEPLQAIFAKGGSDPAAMIRAASDHLAALSHVDTRDALAVQQVHAALIDPEVGNVAAFAAASGMATRTLERFTRNAFGFSPKILLRRQRFLRSLAQFMLDPSLSWLSTLDHHYHDQAHFVRDFRRFMTMSPSQYRQLPHPVLRAAARARAEASGAAMQVLHQPGTISDA